MPFLAFQSLLAAGFRLRAREQVMAINAAAFPHLKEDARERVIAALEAQTERGEEETATSSGDWDKLRNWVAIDRLQYPMKRRPQKGTEG